MANHELLGEFEVVGESSRSINDHHIEALVFRPLNGTRHNWYRIASSLRLFKPPGKSTDRIKQRMERNRKETHFFANQMVFRWTHWLSLPIPLTVLQQRLGKYRRLPTKQRDSIHYEGDLKQEVTINNNIM